MLTHMPCVCLSVRVCVLCVCARACVGGGQAALRERAVVAADVWIGRLAAFLVRAEYDLADVALEELAEWMPAPLPTPPVRLMPSLAQAEQTSLSLVCVFVYLCVRSHALRLWVQDPMRTTTILRRSQALQRPWRGHEVRPIERTKRKPPYWCACVRPNRVSSLGHTHRAAHGG
jgi:hypothetical protein